jgi:nucleoside-diphosphate-sugar epimerase
MRFLISGANGFLGKAIKQNLDTSGHTYLTVLHEEIGSKMSPKNNYMIEKIRNFKPEALIHSAWNVNHVNWKATLSNEKFILDSINFFKQIIPLGLKKIIGIGSCYEYEPSTELISESSSLSYKYQYAIDKHYMREQIFKLSSESNIESVWVRVFNLYGPGDHLSHLIPTLIEAKKKNTTVLLQNPDTPINYLHVHDAAEAIIKFGISKTTSNSIFNLSSEFLVTPSQITSKLHSANLEIENTYFHGSSRHLQPFYWADISKIMDFGWKPERIFNNELMKLISM